MMPPRIYRSEPAPTDITTFEGVMLEHVDYVIHQSQDEKEPNKRKRYGKREFGALFGSVWTAQKLPKIPHGIKGFSVLYHGIGEITAGWYWRKGKPDVAEEVWISVREWNPMFLKIMEPLTSMGVSEKEGNDVARLWQQHQDCLREYFKAVPRYDHRNLSRPMKICLAVAAEFGGLLDLLAARRYSSRVGSRITFDKIGAQPEAISRDELWRVREVLDARYGIIVAKEMEPGRMLNLLYSEIEAEIQAEVQQKGGFDRDIDEAESYEILIGLLQGSPEEVNNFKGDYSDLVRRVKLERYERYVGKERLGYLSAPFPAEESGRETAIRVYNIQKKKEAAGMSGISSKFKGQQIEYWN